MTDEQVDTDKLHVIRATEPMLLPERGATLGNFGAMAVAENESSVAGCEGLWNEAARKRGAKGATFATGAVVPAEPTGAG